MTNNNPGQDSMNRRNSENGKFDREINAALAKYTAVEPRAGLDARVLANLRAEQHHASVRVGWRWPALGATAAVLIVAAVSFMWRTGKPTPNTSRHQPQTRMQSDKQTGTRIAANHTGSPARASVNTVTAKAATEKPAKHGVRVRQAVAASGPRLDHFPSPRPLTKEEKLLVRYVQDFPQEAVMIAKEQTEFEQEMEKLGGGQPAGTNSNQPDQQER